MCRRFFAVLLLGFSVSLVSLPPAIGRGEQRSKPIREVTSEADAPRPPDELREAIAQTPLIVRVVIGETRQETVGIYSADIPEVVWTAAARVQEVIKGQMVADQVVRPDTILVSQLGGDVDRGTYIARHRLKGIPFLRSGEEYVLFLYWVADSQRWLLRWGGDGIWQVTRGRVHSEGNSVLAKRMVTLPAEVALANLRAVASR